MRQGGQRYLVRRSGRSAHLTVGQCRGHASEPGRGRGDVALPAGAVVTSSIDTCESTRCTWSLRACVYRLARMVASMSSSARPAIMGVGWNAFPMNVGTHGAPSSGGTHDTNP
jgi:hypothetical protein